MDAGQLLKKFSHQAVKLSGPIVVACLLVDISLGLINRFAQQLNAYVLAMPIKSGLASFLLYFYLAYILLHAQDIYQIIYESLYKIQQVIPRS